MDNIPSDNGRRKRLPSFRQMRRSAIDEIEGMITGGGQQHHHNTKSNNTRLPQHIEEGNKSSMFSIGGPIDNTGGGGGRRRTPTPPLEQSDYFSDGDDSPTNLYNFSSSSDSPRRSSSQYNNFDTLDGPPLHNLGDYNNNTTLNQPLRSAVPQNPFGRVDIRTLLKAIITILVIGWMTGTVSLSSITHLPSQAAYLLTSPLDIVSSIIPGLSSVNKHRELTDESSLEDEDIKGPRPDFVYEHPYVSSSYYTSTKSIDTLTATHEYQVMRNLRREAEELAGIDPNNPRESEQQATTKTRLAIVRPFCEFDAEALPTTFTCWNALPPCKAASDDIGGDDDEEEMYEVDSHGELIAYKNSKAGERHLFDLVGSDAMKNAKADVFLFYSQTFAENDVAIKAVDAIIDQFFEPGGWSQCFDNIYAIEANIPQELDLYIPSAQEELYNWVNGPNRQFEAAFRIIQSGEWGEYDGFYLMEGDSVPIKAHWLDVVLSEIEVNRPFAILGAQYDGDKWDNFYEKIPISLLHHTNGNAIYNTSHPLLERLVGQLEVEAPCPYNSIPYDYRMSQMWVEGTLGIVPDLAPKIMLNEEGENITLSDNTDMFKKWAEIWEQDDPFKYTPVIHNYAATNLIPRHLGPEYIIHGAKLYSPWNPTKTEVTLVISEWFFDRSLHLIKNLDEKDHPFSEVVVMVPPVAGSHDDYDELTDVPVRTQHRGAPDFMDLCEAEVNTEWFMITNSYHHVARHVDLMFTPGTFKPVIPFTPATYAFCFKYPYCKETVNLAQRIHPGQDKVILDMDMLYNTEARNAFCKQWKEANGEEGEDLYKHQQRRLMFRKKIIGPPGPTGTAYFAWLVKNGKDSLYKMTDRSLYGARPPFAKIFAKEEKLDGMSEDELAKRVGLTLLDNSTDCNCGVHETELECAESGIGCIWRPLFESCHPPELIDGGEPICTTTIAPTMAPTLPLPEGDTDAPTTAPSETATLAEDDPWYSSMFKSREHDAATTEANSTEDSSLAADDDDSIPGPDDGGSTSRKLAVANTEQDSLYETDQEADQRLKLAGTHIIPSQKDDNTVPSTPDKTSQDSWVNDDQSTEKRSPLIPSKGYIKPKIDDAILLAPRKPAVYTDVDPSAPDIAKIDAAAKTQDFWMESKQTVDHPPPVASKKAGDAAIDKPTVRSRGRKLAVNSADPWYNNDIAVDKHLKSKNPNKFGSEEYISYNDMMKEEHKLEAALRNADYTDHMSLDGIKNELHYNDDRYSDTIETLSLEDMIQEEHKLESVLQKQETEMEAKSHVISNLRKEELHYESEIVRLEKLLADMEHSPSHNHASQDEDIDITEF